MKLTVNGEGREFPEGTTIEKLIQDLGINQGRLACEVNMSIVKRAMYKDTILKDGDAVEIVQMIGGG